MRKRTIGIVAGVILALGTVFGLGPATQAHALSSEVCNLSSQCLNAWNGGPYVNTYGPGVGNDNFGLQPIYDRCQNGSDRTTPNCPYQYVPGGLLIVQIEYLNISGNCVGDFNGLSGDARAGAFDACNNPGNGQGGSYGTVFFEYPGGCPGGYFSLLSFHWVSGVLNPSGSGNDQPWYLNSSANEDCLN